MAKKKHKDVLITLVPGDGPDMTRAVTEACLRQSASPLLMDIPPASEATALEAALKSVEEAALYMPIIGHGPSAHELSVVEQLYRRAVEREIPCLMYMIGDEATRSANGSEREARLAAFREQLRTEQEVFHFKSVADLRAQVVDGLSAYHESDITALHYVGEIPSPPEEYVAHPYTLLPTGKMIGRQKQLDLLTEWVTTIDHAVRVLNVVAIGGMGKSAMTWKWYKEIAPEVMKPLEGRMWWSFYESDAYFENFIIRALAYVTNSPEEEIREITPPERERELLEVLDARPFLIVMDGIERILISYARLDAAWLDDDDLDEQTANMVAGAIGMPPDAEQSMFSPHRLRKTADPRAGAFLRKLTQVKASRILVSTRLYPADLQRLTGYPIAGAFAVFLTGLDDDDALALWRAFGVNGEREELLEIFHTFDNYPLLIRALAGAVSRFTPAPGDFHAWRKAHPGFDPLKQTREQVKSHVMTYAFQGLTEPQRKVLDTIASFRMPSYFDTLARLLVRQGDEPEEKAPGRLGGLVSRLTGKTKFARFERESELDAALAELEDRGLMGWDRRANRYDLHPIVRNVAWNALDEKARRGLYSTLNAHFGSLPAVSIEDVSSLEDLTATIEMYNTLIGLKQYDEAFAVYTERLNQPMLRRLSASLQRIELLEMLFPDGLERPPKLARRAAQARCLNSLALAYHASGQPGRAAPMYFRAASLAEQENHPKNVSIGLGNMSDTLRHTGTLRAAEMVANRALLIDRAQEDRAGEALALQFIGLVHAARGAFEQSNAALGRSLRILTAQKNIQLEGVCTALLAQQALWMDDPAAARPLADRAWLLADHAKYENDYIRAARYQGAAALGMGDLETAEERLHHALTRARAVNNVEYELPALIGLAELQRQRGNFKAARSLLEDVWEPAERGPYRLLHADAYLVLTQIEIDEGQPDAARQTAKAAFYLGWCDGAPYEYGWGMAKARAYLKLLEAPEPDDLPPFEASAYGPYLEAEIDPADEFGAGGVPA